MALRQFYRGNPETKNYVVYNNFSGGMNTTAIDDAVADNEYRRLENVDLSTIGSIQNRKGFGNFSILNEIISSEPSFDLNDYVDYCLVRIISDEDNIITVMKDTESLEKFNQKMLGIEYTIKILMVAQEQSSGDTKVLLLTITKEDETTTTTLVEKHSLDVAITNTDILGVNALNYENKIYFLLNDVNNTLEGFGVYDLDTDEFTVVNSEVGYYVPNPYEVSNIGYNLLASQPLNNISLDNVGIAQIRGMYITPQGQYDTILSKVPADGKITLTVIFKGVLNSLDLVPKIYKVDEFGESTDIPFQYTEVDVENDADGLLRYNLDIILDESPEIVIGVRKTLLSTDYTHTYATLGDAITALSNKTKNYLTADTLTKYKCYVPNDVLISHYNFKSFEFNEETRDGRTTTNITGTSIPYFVVDPIGTIVTQASPVYTEFANKLTYAIRRKSSDPTYLVLYLAYYNSSGIITTQYTLSTTTTFDSIINDISDYSLNFIDVVRTGTDPDYVYYTYNGGVSGTTSDFDVLTEDDLTTVLLSNFITYDIGVDVGAKPIETISTKDTNALVIKDRLVLYSGNTIIFSDIAKFNYFPNFNYIILPLNGADKIQKIAYFRGSYMIFTKETIYRLSGNIGTSDMSVVLINDSIGCVAPNSVRSINNTLIFQARDGLYVIKQNYYLDGLENVGKIDKNINGVINVSPYNEAFLYNEQYFLLMKDKDGNYEKTLKQYYNMEYATKNIPYVLDKYTVVPNYLFNHNGTIFSIMYGDFYIYDIGYTDFMPIDVIPEEVINYSYKMSITTPNYALGFTTHDKKFKNIYIKTDSEVSVPVYVTLFINNSVWKTPYEFAAVVNDDGEIEYYEILGRTDLNTTEMATTESESNIILAETQIRYGGAITEDMTFEQVLDKIKVNTGVLDSNELTGYYVTANLAGIEISNGLEDRGFVTIENQEIGDLNPILGLGDRLIFMGYYTKETITDEGFCSIPEHTTQETCISNSGVWTSNLISTFETFSKWYLLDPDIEDYSVVPTIDPDLVLGFFDLGIDKLGTNRYQVHKIVVSGKGKTLALKIEQKLNEYFAIQDIGILYKLGKVRESR